MDPTEPSTIETGTMNEDQSIATIIKTARQRRPGQIRLFHGRGGCYPNLEHFNLDFYPPALMLTVYKAVDEPWLLQLSQALALEFAGELETILVQERHLQGAPTRLLQGELPDQSQVREEGLCFHLNLIGAQNTGFFPDMQTGRTLVRGIAQGKKVLNLFAYSCSFSVAALAGGASSVVNLDMSRSALELGRRNHQLNALPERSATFLCHDLFKSFSKLRNLGPFDLIILDPPAAQGRSFLAERDWPKLVARLPGLLRPDGEVVACVSAPHLGRNFLQQCFATRLPEAQLLSAQTSGEDFPESCPEKGLHILHYRWPGAGALPETRPLEAMPETLTC